MKKLMNFSTLALAIILAGASAFATTNGGTVDTTNTTLSAAITATTNPVCVASATGITLPSATATGSYFVVDQEIMQARSNPNGTCYQVNRGLMGSIESAHANAALVWVGAAAVSSGDSSRPYGGALIAFPPAGPCIQNQQYTLPMIIAGEPYGYSRTGQAWTCFATSASATGKWGPVNPSVGQTYGGTIASVAGAQGVPGTMFTVSGTNAITSFTLPTGFPAGACLTIIPSGAFTTTATNNINKASTAVAGVTLLECYDGTKLSPSY